MLLLGKKRKLGRKIKEISVGEKLAITEKIEDKDLLLYLGLTNDANPLYIQHDYASQTSYKKPIVPSIMLAGIISSAISKYLPGPGSHIKRQDLQFLKPVYHYSSLEFLFEVVEVNLHDESIIIDVRAENQEQEIVLLGSLQVCPPPPIDGFNGDALDNF
jgi:3-hydroxybutyryl-CoA dehydratase